MRAVIIYGCPSPGVLVCGQDAVVIDHPANGITDIAPVAAKLVKQATGINVSTEVSVFQIIELAEDYI